MLFTKYGKSGMIKVSACKNSEQYVQSSSITDDIQVAPLYCTSDEHAFVKKTRGGFTTIADVGN